MKKKQHTRDNTHIMYLDNTYIIYLDDTSTIIDAADCV